MCKHSHIGKRKPAHCNRQRSVLNDFWQSPLGSFYSSANSRCVCFCLSMKLPNDELMCEEVKRKKHYAISRDNASISCVCTHTWKKSARLEVATPSHLFQLCCFHYLCVRACVSARVRACARVRVRVCLEGAVEVGEGEGVLLGWEQAPKGILSDK